MATRTLDQSHRPRRAREAYGRTIATEAREWVGLAAFTVILILAWLIAIALGTGLLLGWASNAITSDSMAPSIRAGDVVLAQPTNGDGLGVGTVITFNVGSGLVTHRIGVVNPDGSYLTKGDANAESDSTPVTPEQVMGVGRIASPWIGLPTLWLRNGDLARLGFLAAALGAGFWLAGGASPHQIGKREDAPSHGDGVHAIKDPFS